MIGTREPEIYGEENYLEICENIREFCKKNKVSATIFQSNHEGEIIDTIQDSSLKFDGIVINPGALTHYSYGIYDALLMLNIPIVEVHITNIYQREKFRHNSVIAGACIGQICGFGVTGYKMAIDYIQNINFK